MNSKSKKTKEGPTILKQKQSPSEDGTTTQSYSPVYRQFAEGITPAEWVAAATKEEKAELERVRREDWTKQGFL